MKKAISVLFLALSAISASTLAEASSVYAGVQAGQASADFNTVSVSSNTGLPAAFFVGYTIVPNFAMEFQHMELGSVKIASISENAIRISGNSLTAVGSLPLSKSFSLFAKLGVAITKIDFPSITQGGTGANSDITYSVGGQYDFTSHISGRLDYSRYSISNDLTGQGGTDVALAGLVVKF